MSREADPFAIITAVYYLLFGGVGLLVNNTFLNEVNALLCATGIAQILEHSGISVIKNIAYIPLILCAGTLLYKVLAETIKMFFYRNNKKLSEISLKKYYNIPIAITCVFVTLYTCTALYIYNIYLTISLIFFTNMSISFAVYKYFWQNLIHSKKLKFIIVRLCIATLFGCVGLGTRNIVLEEKWLWVTLLTGDSIANICISYALYNTSQLLLLLLMRGQNLQRKTVIRGNNILFVVYYTGRLAPLAPLSPLSPGNPEIHND